MVMEPLLHKECKMKKWEDAGPRKPKAMIVEATKINLLPIIAESLVILK